MIKLERFLELVTYTNLKVINSKNLQESWEIEFENNYLIIYSQNNKWFTLYEHFYDYEENNTNIIELSRSATPYTIVKDLLIQYTIDNFDDCVRKANVYNPR